MLSKLRRWIDGEETQAVFLLGDPTRLAPIAQALQPFGLRGAIFSDPAAMYAAQEQNPPLVFVDLSLGVAAAGEAILGLARRPQRPAIQLVSPVEIAGYEQVAAIGQLRLLGSQNGMKMPQALQPPYRNEAIGALIADLGLGHDGERVTLAQALRKDWLELWYQPKIDLASKRLAGAEGLIRVRHPHKGTLLPGSFLPGAAEADLLRMTECVIVAALRDWEAIAAHGISIRLAVNVPVSALTRLDLAGLLRRERPHAANWPGLILEVTEDEIVNDLRLANDMANELRAHGCSLAIDDFGAGYSSLARLRQLPFSELKIDRSYVTNCHIDRTNAALCEVIIDLARRVGLKTVAEGIETAHESHKLQSIGCDVGQGYLFARPMERGQLVSLLQRRMVGGPRPAQASLRLGLLSGAKS
jgi:EAL domain-containing protein (putative c-di-GMP-specific phosphodiesterase class I)